MVSSTIPPVGPRLIGTLVVVIIKARNLPNRVRIGKQSPFATIHFGLTKKKTTSIERGGQFPVWDEEFRLDIPADMQDLAQPDQGLVLTKAGGVGRSEGDTGTGGKEKPVPPPPLRTKRTLRLACWADDPRDPKLVGETIIDLEPIIKKGVSDEWWELRRNDRYAGEIFIEMTMWSNAPEPAKKLRPPSPSISAYGGPGERASSPVSDSSSTRGHSHSGSTSSLTTSLEIASDYPDADINPLAKSISTLSINRHTAQLPQPPERGASYPPSNAPNGTWNGAHHPHHPSHPSLSYSSYGPSPPLPQQAYHQYSLPPHPHGYSSSAAMAPQPSPTPQQLYYNHSPPPAGPSPHQLQYGYSEEPSQHSSYGSYQTAAHPHLSSYPAAPSATPYNPPLPSSASYNSVQHGPAYPNPPLPPPAPYSTSPALHRSGSYSSLVGGGEFEALAQQHYQNPPTHSHFLNHSRSSSAISTPTPAQPGYFYPPPSTPQPSYPPPAPQPQYPLQPPPTYAPTPPSYPFPSQIQPHPPLPPTPPPLPFFPPPPAPPPELAQAQGTQRQSMRPPLPPAPPALPNGYGILASSRPGPPPVPSGYGNGTLPRYNPYQVQESNDLC